MTRQARARILPRAALAAAAAAGTVMAAGPAAAAEKITLELGGEYIQYFGYAANSKGATGGDFSGFDQKYDGSLDFGGQTTLDNGIDIGLAVSLTPQTDDDQIDGTYLFGEGAFGRFELGSVDSVAVLMHVAAPEVGFGINDSDISDWIINTTGGDADSAFQSTYLYVGEYRASKASYYTPRFYGLQIAASFIPEYENNNNAQPNTDLYHDGYALAANFEHKFGDDVELKLSVGYVGAKEPEGVAGGKAAQGVSFGGNLVIGAWTIGGSYAATDGNPSGGTDTSISLEGSGYDLGVSYAIGAGAVSLAYYHGEIEDQVAVQGDSTHETIMLSGTYEIGPGVSLLASLFNSRFASDAGAKNDGWAIVTGLKLEF